MVVHPVWSVSSDVVVAPIQGTEFRALHPKNQQVNVKNVHRLFKNLFFLNEEHVYLFL